MSSTNESALVVNSNSSRSYRQSDIKKLFALSYNQCLFPACEVQLSSPDWPYVAADVAHIYGLNQGAARHVPTMTNEERNSFENLILVCRNHHQLMDELEPDNYPAERLLGMKSSHENRRGGGESWCSDSSLDDTVKKLALTLRIVLLESKPRTVQASPLGPKPPTPKARRKNTRLHELAKELGMTNVEIMDLSDKLGVGAKNHSSSVIDQQADRIRRRAEREGLTRPTTP